MTYANGYPVRPVAGRLALDFINTADWAADGSIVHEKIETLADLNVWMRALGLPDAGVPDTVQTVHAFRRELRSLFETKTNNKGLDLETPLRTVRAAGAFPFQEVRESSIIGLIALSALSLISDDRELSRIKECPGHDCGWLFLDETKNARRKWCIMETCGNRAKASRHYAKKVRAGDAR